MTFDELPATRGHLMASSTGHRTWPRVRHAEPIILSRLADASVTDTVRQAIETKIAALAADPALLVRAQYLAVQVAGVSHSRQRDDDQGRAAAG